MKSRTLTLSTAIALLAVLALPIPVAAPATLCRMKRDTARPDDRRDAERLRERFGLAEH